MHSLTPMHMSYDIYTFIFSLLREPKVWDYVRNVGKIEDDHLDLFSEIINSLWFPDDKQKISDFLEQSYKIHRFNVNRVQTLNSRLKEEYDINFDQFFENVEKMNKKEFEQLYKHNDLRTYKTAFDEKNNHLIGLRSIKVINQDFVRMNIKLKYDIDDTYGMLKLNPPSYIDSMIDEYDMVNPSPHKVYQVSQKSVGKERHICMSKCRNGHCQTNHYKQFKKNYDSDDCINTPD